MGLNCNSLIEKNNIMKIKILNGGFAQIPDNPLISRIVIKYCDLFRSDCDVFCKNMEVYHLKIMCSVFNSQYGLATSSDGKMLISGTWERGIFAYNIQSGLLVWRYPKGKSRTIIVSDNELIIARAYSSVFKLDIDSGNKKESEIKTGSLENIYPLNNELFFLNSFRGQCCVVSNKDLRIVHVFGKSETNPNHCLSFIINEVKLNRSNTITIKGYEDYPNSSFDPSSLIGTHFSRELQSFRL